MSDDPLPSNVLPFVIPEPETEEMKKARVARLLALFDPSPEAAKPPEKPIPAPGSPRNFGEFLDSLPPGSKLTGFSIPKSFPPPPPLPPPTLRLSKPTKGENDGPGDERPR
jgi:hypothetical protein